MMSKHLPVVGPSGFDVESDHLVDPERESKHIQISTRQMSVSLGQARTNVTSEMEEGLGDKLGEVVEFLGTGEADLRVHGPDCVKVKRDQVALAIARRVEEERLHWEDQIRQSARGPRAEWFQPGTKARRKAASEGAVAKFLPPHVPWPYILRL
jgi:hypothetical protein